MLLFVQQQFPTYFYHSSATNPDIILNNNKIFHHHHFSYGPLTPSNHIPIIAKISANIIQIAVRPKQSMKQAKWDKHN